ncbi:MAG: hypothetical protein JWO05_2990 [Gemmatimonadetes bacterium]|nr:hypothetical protein [Gemmatimonadota bacterium]
MSPAPSSAVRVFTFLSVAVGVTLAPSPSKTPMRDTLPGTDPSPIVELRQYTTQLRRRDDLISMFDAAFVEPQESAGITVIGQFRNIDDPNKFVWLRGFPTMEDRARGLTEFYGGTAWRSRRDAANATIIDNDNVLLLRPVHPGTGFVLDPNPRPPAGAVGSRRGLVVATIYHLDPTEQKEQAFVEFFERSVTPLLTGAGAPVIATFLPERSSNNFPRLPVREGEHVFVWFTRFPDLGAYEQFQRTLATTPGWRDSVEVELSSMVREPQVLRLAPTVRSRLHE